ncbi:MAG: hypothetical protein CVU56_18755 [Deltaproteobacteria bacterium HGW-Deltaproteobacteria-14]|jgi:hypothetical protein|nr:MAG: hypothetical protein CVU56_18755 [Deltaproteobacteria bacterium HGW-Deltaproteobacteria-14]
MYRWKTAVEPTARNTKLLVADSEGNELLKAVLPSTPQHPRALLTLLEGLALWAGEPLTAVISAGPTLPRRVDEALFGAGILPMDSALVRFEMVGPVRRRRTLSGMGDFRRLRLVQRRCV